MPDYYIILKIVKCLTAEMRIRTVFLIEMRMAAGNLLSSMTGLHRLREMKVLT